MSDFYPARRNFFKTRTLDITFTIILGLFTFVFGYYVFISIRNFKAAKAKKVLVASVVPPKKASHHKKKHRLKISTESTFPKISVADKTEILPSQPAPVIQPPTQTPVIQSQISAAKNSISNPTIAVVNSGEVKPGIEIQSTEKHPVNEANLPYTTYLRANETGVINMRKLDNYGSEIIKVIPANSEVAVLEKGSSYYKILFENTTGYVAKWNVLKM